MAADAFMVQYDMEFVQAYRRMKALLGDRVLRRGMVQGNQFVFDVYGNRTASAVTRGPTGDIPYSAPDQTQVTVTMEQWHAPLEKNGFNIFSSQGDQRRGMQEESACIINRKVDDQIIDAIVAGTTRAANASAETLSVGLALKTIAGLMSADVPVGTGVTGLLTPAAWRYLVENDQVSSKDYVDTSMFADAPMMFKWCGVDWLVHTGLPGIGTASESLYVFHKNAVGYGMDTAGIKNEADFEKKHDRSWVRSTFYGNAKMLQTAGSIKILHDATGVAIS